ncbi:MAG: M24 family metallopeptidase [Acidimicrobiales bacterium]
MSSKLPPLVAMDVAGRLDRLRAVVSDHGCDALLVTRPANVRWLTTFAGSNGQLIVTDRELVAVTDGRYEVEMAERLTEAGVAARVEITVTGLGDILDGALPTGAKLGLEAHHVTWQRRDQVAAWLPGRPLVATTGVVEELRKVKDGGELARLRRAAAIADRALDEVVPCLGDGLTERAVARLLDNRMLELGADEPSYDTIVAAGPNSARPHAHPTDRPIQPTDLVVIDVGARLDGYGSDMTRTFVAGGEPSDDQRRLYDAVIEAQAEGVAAVAADVEELTVDTVCRAVLARHHLADAFIHGTGHGIGLEIHEDPILSQRSAGRLRDGYVVTVEPGVYLPDRGGVRIEDAVLVTAVGCEPLTHSPKTMIPWDRPQQSPSE